MTSLFLAGGLVTLFSFLASERLIPQTNATAKKIFSINIKKEPLAPSPRVFREIVLSGRDGHLYSAQALNLDTNTLERVIVNSFVNGEKTQEINALAATWNGSQWIFKTGVRRTYQNKTIEEKPFEELALSLPEAPADMIPMFIRPEEMNTHQLKGLIARNIRLGQDHHSLSVALFKKYAYPFSNIMVMMIAIPFALQLKRAGRMKSFAYTLGVAFCYWGMMSAGEALALSRVLPVWVGVWLPNMTFGLTGLYCFKKYV